MPDPAVQVQNLEKVYRVYAQPWHRLLLPFGGRPRHRESAFGREALERLISDAVPDLGFEPGDLHHRLLELPWADVFTTNWDTLLERGASRVVDRHYDVVRTMADIPASARPRIVKLHGTLPAVRPLIFTEDDFRTYPIRFAPLVNLAQQSMMETVFCLIGFSGDDPNFLYWSGWIRDHLKEYAPRIYLVGWLDLPPPRRRMLESRGVVPVDLAHLALPIEWPEETRQQRALEWFLWSLKAAEPYRETDWPESPGRSASNPPTYFPAVLFEDSGFPLSERAGPEHSANLDELRSTVHIWRHNRQIYPGWLVAPRSSRFHFWWYTENWIPAVLELVPALAPAERIEVLEELNWRLETCLVPLTPELVEAISKTLTEIDPLAFPVSRSEPEKKVNRTLPRRWVKLATALLRAGREADDDAVFEFWAKALAPHRTDHSWLGPRIAYERCLLSLARLDHVAVERALDELDTGADEVYWKVRKAGILAEVGKIEESFQLAGEALSGIRQQLGHGSVDIPTLSREGWAMVLAEGFSFYPHPREPLRSKKMAPTGSRGLEPKERSARRWEVLRHHKCDAREDLNETQRTLEDEPPVQEPKVVERSGFDPGHTTRFERIVQWDSKGGWDHLPGLQAKRLFEETGIPPVVDRVATAKKLYLRAAEWLAEPAPSLSLGLILRASSYEGDETFDEFLNRSRIAQLTDSQVEAIVGRVGQALDYGVPRTVAAIAEENSDRSNYWLGRIRVAVEVLSRLVLRMDGERAERVLDRALHYYNLSLFRQNHWIIRPLGNLFYRTITALGPERIRAHIGGFLALPLPEEGDFCTHFPDVWPDPFRLAANSLGDAPLELCAMPEWDQTIKRLIAVVASTPLRYPRGPAIQRLEVLWRWRILTEGQEAGIGEALWKHRLPPSGFPEGTGFLDAAFLALPVPEPELAENLFRERYLRGASDPHRPLYVSDFWSLLWVVNFHHQGKSALLLSASDVEQVLDRILCDWRIGDLRQAVESPRSWRASFDLENYRKAFAEALGKVILPRLEALSSHVGEVVELVADLRSLDFPVEATYPALARLRPDLLPEIFDRLRQSLASSRREQAEAAVQAVWWWLREGQVLGLGEPSPDLVREIAIAISMRRPSLKDALHVAEWILQNDAVVEADRFARLVAEGLGYLLSEARYEVGLVRKPALGFGPNEIVELRLLCVKMALALEHSGFGDLHSVGEWIREGETDPFPEVRHTLSAREAVLLAEG